jgi:hypothetical protein
MMNPTQPQLESILSDLPVDERENMRQAFSLLGALDFVKYLHRADLPDKLKSALLAARVRIPQTPADKEAIVQASLEESVQNLWARIGAIQEQ